MKNTIKSVIIFTIVICFTISALFYIRKLTYPYIVKQETDNLITDLESVMPGCSISEEIKSDTEGDGKFSYWIGTKSVDGVEKKYFAFITVNYVFNTVIKTVAGVDGEGKITGVSIHRMTDTPGLSARLIERTYTETARRAIPEEYFSREDITESWFQEQFRGIDLNKKIPVLNKGFVSLSSKEEFLVKNAIAVNAGSTAVAVAITDALKEGFVKLKKAGLMHEQMQTDQNKEEVK